MIAVETKARSKIPLGNERLMETALNKRHFPHEKPDQKQRKLNPIKISIIKA